MKKYFIYFVLMAFVMGFCGAAFAARTAHGNRFDHRIKQVGYNRFDVVKIFGYVGVQTVIFFEEDEAIKDTFASDTSSWHVIPNGSSIVIKPQAHPDGANNSSNLTVTTTKRTYTYELLLLDAVSSNNRNVTYTVRYNYPEDAVKNYKVPRKRATRNNMISAKKITDLAFDYTYSGFIDIAPIQVFDDGKFTYFKFTRQRTLPAVFWVDTHRNEHLVNYRMEGEYLVVERIAKQYTLRDGQDVVSVFKGKKPKDIARSKRQYFQWYTRLQ